MRTRSQFALVLIMGLLFLFRSLGQPRVRMLHGVDIAGLIGCGACLGIGIVGLIGLFRFPEK